MSDEMLVPLDDAPYATVACPNCGADDTEHRYRLRISAIVSCRRCGQSYVNPRVVSAELERKLQAWAEQDIVDQERLRASFETAALTYYGRFLRWMTSCSTLPGRRLLDIGCSTGGFLSVARAAAWEVCGIEVGRASARHARDVLKLNVHHGSLYDYPGADESFDAVSMIEVIEHLERPRDALLQARRLLVDGGLLLITTPNFDSLYRRCHGNRWWVINCEDEHIVLFTLETLENMLEASGFEVVLRRVQGVDWLGIWRGYRDRKRLETAATPPAHTAVAVYYGTRAAKAKLKAALAKIGLLSVARRLTRLVDLSFTWRWSPTYVWGEQLVIVARRVDDAKHSQMHTAIKD